MSNSSYEQYFLKYNTDEDVHTYARTFISMNAHMHTLLLWAPEETEPAHHLKIDEVATDAFVVGGNVSSHWMHIAGKPEINPRKMRVPVSNLGLESRELRIQLFFYNHPIIDWLVRLKVPLKILPRFENIGCLIFRASQRIVSLTKIAEKINIFNYSK